MARIKFMGGAAIAVLVATLWGAGANAQPAQYTKDDVIKAFSKAPAAAAPADGPASGDCPSGTAMGDDGVCAPVMHTRGFSLVDPRHLTTAHKAAGAHASANRPTPHIQPKLARAAVSAGDLLITFRTGSSELTEQGRANAKVFASGIDSPALAGSRFEISGHTDSKGAATKNMNLSEARAQAVRQQLIQDGVAADRLVAKGYGAQQPVAGMSPAAAANRRVEAHRLDMNG